MPASLQRISDLTKSMPPAVTIGLLVAAAALTWYAAKTYQRQKAAQLDIDLE
jgi:hypothetical protein